MMYVVLVLLGLCFGSFVNAFVWRLHEQSSRKKLTKKQRKDLSIIHGRSMCPHCRHELTWYDLLPLISWLMLGGKCRYCHRKIEDSPLVELVTAGLFVGSYAAWPYGFDAAGWAVFAAWLVFVVGFVALTVYDLRWMLLPNRIVYALIGLAVVQTVFRMVTYDAGDFFADAFWGFITIGGLFYVLFQVSGGRWIGGGDVKLGFLIGILVGGPLNGFLTIFIASTLGTLVMLPFMATKSVKITSRIPFGPFLLAATVVCYLYADAITDWYAGILL